ncbi:uncharacterized protein LOC131048634 isoform X1 [Cryptomeria japonica]|uniref:uncharacterized protein LOC131048634 isoform X1 n=2 Tax=Cryptomeria japonica TaxID=3369 RepID=UPI0027DA5CCF|nr:uncharacterized protein LOC131048634 isoform X1 [Cryptomeria japonica]
MAGLRLLDKLRKLWETFPSKAVLSKTDRRQMQHEADVHRLFLATSYNHFIKTACEKEPEEICDLASRISFQDQQKQVQEYIHVQIQAICQAMDDMLIWDEQMEKPKTASTPMKQNARRSGLSFAVGATANRTYPDMTAVAATRSMKNVELSSALKERIGYTLELKPSQVCHEKGGQGLYLSGKAGIGAVVSFYPGVIYSPSNYRYIPGYPRVDAGNPYLISRYDGIVIDAQPWGTGGETREFWNGIFDRSTTEFSRSSQRNKADVLWQTLSKPKQNMSLTKGAVVERRNPLALGHFANHPDKGMQPNVMICPYNFPLSDTRMRTYIPNLLFGSEEEVIMERYGSFWLKSTSADDINVSVPPAIRTLVLVATRPICDEEIFLNYRLSNPKRRPDWYHPVDEEEDRRRWS